MPMSGWHDTANVLDNPTEIFRFLLLEPPFEREWFSSARKRMDINDLRSAFILNVKSRVDKSLLSWCTVAAPRASFGQPALNNCLRLERVIRGIKRAQGTTKRLRLPVTFAVLERFYSLLE